MKPIRYALDHVVIRVNIGLKPDMFTLGKPLAGGVPAAIYGFSQEVADRFHARLNLEDSDVGGIGGTLAGNALSIAAMRATLEHVLTEAAYKKAIESINTFYTWSRICYQ